MLAAGCWLRPWAGPDEPGGAGNNGAQVAELQEITEGRPYRALRVGYQRAAALFSEASGGATLHQLRHSAPGRGHPPAARRRRPPTARRALMVEFDSGSSTRSARRPSAIRDSATPAVFHERTARTISGAFEQGWRYRSCQMSRGDCLGEVTHLAN